ncbi:MAG: hypothetical protein ABI629_13080 [bacterium]
MICAGNMSVPSDTFIGFYRSDSATKSNVFLLALVYGRASEDEQAA